MGARKSVLEKMDEDNLVIKEHVDHRTPIYDLGHGTLHHVGDTAKNVKKTSGWMRRKEKKEENLGTEKHTQMGGYFIQPSSEHVSQVVNGKAAKKSPAFRYVKPTGVKTENANKIFYVKKIASQNDTKFGHPVTPGIHESSAKQDGNGYLECIFCDEIPDVIYMNSLCSHIGCRKCWLGWCKDHLDNLKCPKCGIKTELANVSMITAYERRKLLTFHNGNLDDSKGMNKITEGNLDAIDESDLDDDSDGLETSVTHCDTKYP